jgi:integrase
MRLTDEKIRDLDPVERPSRHYDGSGLGLCLEHRPTGRKTWRLHYNDRGRQVQVTLGDWPGIGVDEARIRAREHQRRVRLEREPARFSGAPGSFWEAAEEWFGIFHPSPESREAVRRRKYLETDIYPVIGAKPLEEVTVTDILDGVLRPVEERGSLSRVKFLRSVLSQIVRHAVASGRAGRELITGLEGAICSKGPVGRAVISSRSLVAPVQGGDTFRQVAKSYIEQFFPLLTVHVSERRTAFLETIIFPLIGDKRFKDITESDVLDGILRPVEERGERGKLLELKTALSQIFVFAMSAGYTDRNLVHDVQGRLKELPKTPRAFMAEPDGIARLMRNIWNYGGTPSVRYSLKILPYVFVRPCELRLSRWEEFDLGKRVWRIPEDRMRIRNPHFVPISDRVKSLLDELRLENGDSEYLFPGPWKTRRDQPISRRSVNAGLRFMGYDAGEICGYGFRSMASAVLREKGYPAELVDLQLSITRSNWFLEKGGQDAHMKARREMMEFWADYLDQLRSDG